MGIKVSVGGKYAGVKREPNPATAGVRREAGSGSGGIKREFVGSGVNSYTFSRVINGIKRTVTIRAHSVKEANSIAASRGYKTTDREIKRRRKRKK